MDSKLFSLPQYFHIQGLQVQPTEHFSTGFFQNSIQFDYVKILLRFQQYRYHNLFMHWIYQQKVQALDLLRKEQPVYDKMTAPIKSQLCNPKLSNPKQDDLDEKNYLPHLRVQITAMVTFFLDEYGQCDPSKIDQQRNRYIYSKPLTELFDSLKEKYSAARKCREDMIRLALRKALTSLRDSLRKQLNISAKAASIELCKRYFGLKTEELVKEEENVSEATSQEDLMFFLLPYKKNSKYSTPNMCFIKEIFTSKEFNQDYMRYLDQLDEILEKDNNKKIPKFINFLVECTQKNLICQVRNYKRLPWSKAWLKATKVVANELLDASSWKEIHRKKPKQWKKIQKSFGDMKLENIC